MTKMVTSPEYIIKHFTAERYSEILGISIALMLDKVTYMVKPATEQI